MTLWPAAATAWAWGMPAGRDENPSLRQPAAMAPEETRMNSRSPERRWPISPTRRWMRGWLRPSAAVRTALPSLRTTRLALLRYCCRKSVVSDPWPSCAWRLKAASIPFYGGPGDPIVADFAYQAEFISLTKILPDGLPQGGEPGAGLGGDGEHPPPGIFISPDNLGPGKVRRPGRQSYLTPPGAVCPAKRGQSCAFLLPAWRAAPGGRPGQLRLSR